MIAFYILKLSPKGICELKLCSRYSVETDRCIELVFGLAASFRLSYAIKKVKGSRSIGFRS